MELPFYKRWIDSLFGPKDISTPILKSLGHETDVDLVKDQEGDILPIPQGHSFDSRDTGFYKYWLQTFRTEKEERINKYKIYNIMDKNSTETQLMLDAYRDEALSIGFLEDPLVIDIEPKEAKDSVFEVLNSAKFFEKIGSNIRSLAKYGDLFYHVYLTKDGASPTVKIRQVDQADVDIIEAPIFKTILGYKISDIKNSDTYFSRLRTVASSVGTKALLPWEIVQFSIEDSETSPYGKSELEKIRTPYDQLATMEALYAVSRASKVERLVVKVPTGANNPTNAFNKLQQIRAAFKSVILGQGPTGRFTANKELGLTDILWLPSDKNGNGEYSIDKIASSIDVSDDNDVRYFLEKVIGGTKIPKAYFLADTVTNRENTLSQMDLRFARTLIPLQKSYVKGAVKLCTIIGLLQGHRDIKVKVSLERPMQVTREQVESYRTQIDAAAGYIKTTLELTNPSQPVDNLKPNEPVPQPSIPPDKYISVLVKFGVPEAVAKCLFDDKPMGVDTVTVTNSTTGNVIDQKLVESIQESLSQLKDNLNESKLMWNKSS